MASEKLLHEKYWACMARTTRMVDSWPEWEKGSANNVRSIDANPEVASTNRACGSSSEVQSMQASVVPSERVTGRA